MGSNHNKGLHQSRRVRMVYLTAFCFSVLKVCYRVAYAYFTTFCWVAVAEKVL